MIGIAGLTLSLSLLSGVYASSPPLSDDEISRISPELQIQFILPSHSLHVHHTRVGFKHRFVDQYGNCHTSRPSSASVAVDATTTVSDLALTKACTIIGLMTRHMSPTIFSYISRGHGVGIFAQSEGMGVYPENADLRDTPQCRGTCSGSCAHTCTFDGRKYDTIAGLTNTRSVVLDDNVLCNERDPYAHQENVLVHEFAHQVHKYMPTEDRNRLEYVFNYIKQIHTWYDGYGTANSAEYWAEATSAFFMTVTRHGAGSPAVGMDECSFNHVCSNEMEAREWLKTHDIWLYQLLSKIYTDNHPETPSGLKIFKCDCPRTSHLLETLLDIIIEHFDLKVYAEISQYDVKSLYNFFLGKPPSYPLDIVDIHEIYELCHTHLVKSSSEYNRLRCWEV